MKLPYLIASASVVLGLASLACSSANDDIIMGGDAGSSSAGTKGQGGSGTGTGGSKANGGTSGGGSSSNGGQAGGGSSSGGSSTGGGATGGGGAGGVSSGGSAGGPSISCDDDSDCVACAYATAPVSAQDCYCPNCGNTPMSKTGCSANEAQFQKVCADVHLLCPAIKCLPPPAPACKNHMCAAK